MTNDTAPPSKRPQPEQRPRRVQPRITAAPKLGQIYWCDFWLDAQLPEMWKTRPVVVLSYKNTLYGPCLVVPLTTEPQGNSPWAFEVSVSIDGHRNWTVCNYLYTTAPNRLSPGQRQNHSGPQPGVQRNPQAGHGLVASAIRS